MRGRYAGSKFRLILLATLLAFAGVLARTAHAQPAPAAEPVTSLRIGVFSILMANFDIISGTIYLLSIIGVTLIIQGFIKNRASVFMPPQTTNEIRQLISQRKFQELIDFTENDPSFISKTLNPALKRAPSFSSMKEAMETAIGEQTAEQFRRIEYLNIIGNLGPLLGLLGTVYGMIVAFSAMQAEGGSASPATLAGGISKALAHTFLGLMLAVPCLAAFGVLRTMVDRLTVRGALVAEELLLMIKPADSRSTSSSPGERATPQPAPGSSAAPSVGRKPASAPPAFQG
jgi:biopolymer transport protein ExbB